LIVPYGRRGEHMARIGEAQRSIGREGSALSSQLEGTAGALAPQAVEWPRRGRCADRQSVLRIVGRARPNLGLVPAERERWRRRKARMLATISTLGTLVHQVRCQRGRPSLNSSGCVVVAKAIRRNKLLEFFASLPPCRVGLEASGSAHHWARELIKLGQTRG
jgi:hypothetical protein